jgi:PhnB protein
MANIHPYLFFKGNAQEAMDFYHGVFGGELEVQKVGDSPTASAMPAETHNSVMHSALMIDGAVFLMASDMSDENTPTGNRVSLTLVCKSKEEIEALFAKLSDGGHVLQPLVEEYFGTFGILVDKYGYNWMFQFKKEGAK